MSAYTRTSAYVTTTDCLIEKSFFQLHRDANDFGLDVIKEDERFGTLTLKMKKTKGEQTQFLSRNKSIGKNKIITASDFSMNFEKK